MKKNKRIKTQPYFNKSSLIARGFKDFMLNLLALFSYYRTNCFQGLTSIDSFPLAIPSYHSYRKLWYNKKNFVTAFNFFVNISLTFSIKVNEWWCKQCGVTLTSVNPTHCYQGHLKTHIYYVFVNFNNYAAYLYGLTISWLFFHFWDIYFRCFYSPNRPSV